MPRKVDSVDVFIHKSETFIEPDFEDKPAISWIYKPDWDNGGTALKDDKSGLWVVIINLANLRKKHRDSIPLHWVKLFGWEKAVIEWISFVFLHELLHWACEGSNKENELIDTYPVNGQGRIMVTYKERHPQINT